MLRQKTNIYLLIFPLVMTLTVFFSPFESYAVPAAPVIHILRQPDGSTFKAKQWGDEQFHGWETQDGYSIVFDENLKGWTYAIYHLYGALTSSSRIVEKDILPVNIKKHIRPVGWERLRKPLKRLSREILLNAQPMLVPPTGAANIPVILINFSDTATTFTGVDFNTLLFAMGNFSMKDYYQEVSYGVFSVSAGPGGVVGWYTTSNTHDYYGQNDASGDDMWPGDLVHETVAAADAAGFNFAPYDQDGDCYVDVVNIIHQGTGEESSGVSTDIWSHRHSLVAAHASGHSHNTEYTTNDACPAGGFIKVNDYVIQPEVLLGGIHTMGVFAHEYGHALGLPDLYDIDSSSEGVGDWSLMGGGSWNKVTRGGDRPAHMDAWSKYKLGWVMPTLVIGTLTSEPITQASQVADIYQIIPWDPSSGVEYFLVENRQKTGFDAALPGDGLLIWHIDETKTNNANECYPVGPSCAANHYKVALVQADGLWELEKKTNSGDTGDPFPGSTGNTFFTSTTNPDSSLYNGAITHISVTDISLSGSTMTATLKIEWIITTVDFAGSVGANTSIAIDSNDKVHISYVDWDNYDLKYATNASGTWVTTGVEYIAGVCTACDTSIAIDSNDKAHISYSAFLGSGIYALKYATNASGTWVTTIVDSGEDVGRHASIAIDSNDKVHISYQNWTEGNEALKYATNASGTWVITTVDSGGTDTSIAIDSNNKVHISYNYNYGFIKYATNASGSWVATVVSAGSGETSIAVDSKDKAHISYRGKYATNASGSWVITTVDSALRTSIAIDSKDKTHISYFGWPDYDLKYATNASGKWATATVDSFTYGYSIENTSIAIDSNDKVHISYFDWDNYDLKYATNAFTLLVVDNDSDGYNSNIDCDDNDPAVNPGMAEVPYNGKDDDCNPSTKDDDLDGDGYLLANDCNDNDPAVNPGMAEVPYNGKDDDCNPSTKDDDLDGDGYLLANDCNDNDPAVNPGMAEGPAGSPTCNDGKDNDCDGVVDAADPACIIIIGLPDLIGQWTSMAVKQVTTNTGIKWIAYGNLKVVNQGYANAGNFVIKFYYISLGGGNLQYISQRSLLGLLQGAATNVSFRRMFISNPTGGSILAVIDADNTVVESSEANNEATRNLP